MYSNHPNHNFTLLCIFSSQMQIWFSPSVSMAKSKVSSVAKFLLGKPCMFTIFTDSVEQGMGRRRKKEKRGRL